MRGLDHSFSYTGKRSINIIMDEIYLEQDGDHAILLLHAYTSYSRDFRVFSNALEEAGYTVYAPHFSGHGIEDPDGVIQHGIDEWVKDGQDALDRLKAKGYEKISVFGLSLGGVVASYLALENPDLVSAGTFSAPVAGNYGLSIEDEFKEWYYNKKQAMGYSQEEVDDFYQDYVQEGLAKVTEGIEAFRQEKMVDRYHEITMPIFIGQGGEDKNIAPEHGQAFKAALVNAPVTFKLYPHAGHVLTIGRVGKELREDLLAFLQEAN